MKKFDFRYFIGICFFYLASFFPLNAQNFHAADTWKIMENANTAFDGKEFGEALKLCETAKQTHIQSIEADIASLKKSLAPAEVKKAGDSIDRVLAVLEKREETSAISIINSVLLMHPSSYFNNSTASLIDWMQNQKAFPEADFLSGKIYEAEGETDLAFSFYGKALDAKAFLDVPDERFTIIYHMADIAKNEGNKGTWEKYLLLIPMEDPIFGKPGEESQTLSAMIRILKSERTVEKFFYSFRHSNFIALKAYQDLASFYYYDSKGRIDRALPVAVLASCISVTELSGVLSRNDFNFEYQTLTDLMIRVGKNQKLVSWAHDKKIWDSFLLVAAILYDDGEKSQAVSLWTILSLYCPDAVIARKALDTLNLHNSIGLNT